MSLDVALSGGDLTTYQTVAYQGTWHLSIFPMTSFATARINQSSFDTPLAQLTVDTTSAAWLDTRKNMIVWVGSTAGAHDVGIYRVRETPGATTLYLMETSPGDPGLVAKRVTKLFADNQYVTIIDAPNIWSVFPRITYSMGNGTFFKDFDDPYTDQNSNSGAVPGILRLGEHTIVRVADSATHTEERTASETLFASSVSSRQWTPPSGASLVSGSATAATVEYEYPIGNHLIKYSETLANTAVMTGQRCVIVHDTTTNPPLEIADLNWDESTEGARLSCTLVSDFDTDILAGAMVFVWQDLDSTAIASACNYMVGFVEKVNGDIQVGLGTATLDIVSPLAVMSRVKGFSQELTYAASPANWQETNIAYYDFWAWYILYYHTTTLQYFDFFPSGRTTRTASGWRAAAGNWLEAVNGCIDADNAQLTADPHGNLYLKRDPFLMTTAERGDLVTRVELTSDLVSSIRYSRRIRPTVHKVEAYAFSVGTGEPTAYRSQAIGNTGGQGSEGSRLTDQRCSQSELNARNGNEYARQNNPYDAITVTLISGYHVIHPALRYLVNLTITDATLLPEGSTEPLDFDCVPDRVSISWEVDERGNATPLITLTLIPLTDGNETPGQTMPIDARVGAELTIPTMDEFGFPELEFEPFGFPDYFGLPPITGFPEATYTGTPGASASGITDAVGWSAAQVVTTEDFDASAPDWTVVHTPDTDNEVIDATQNHVLEDGDTSASAGLYYAADLLAGSPTLQGSAFTGGLMVRKVLGVTDGVAALRITENNLLYDFDFTIDDQDWFQAFLNPDLEPSDPPSLTGVYNPGVGWQKSGIDPGGGGTDGLSMAYDMGANVFLTRIVGTFTASGPEDAFDHAAIRSLPDNSLTVLDHALANVGGTLDSGVVAAAAERYLFVRVNNDYAAGTMVFTEFQAYGQLLKFRYSDDNGATVTETTVGNYAGDTGMDTDDFNVGVKIVAVANGIAYGSSYTGAFSELTGLTGVAAGTQITCVRIPYRKLATQALNSNAASIQFIFGTGAAVSGKTLWGITFNASSGAIIAQSNMTPTVSGTTYYPVGPNAVVTNGDNTQQIIALCKPVGGGSTHILASNDGGNPLNWSDRGAFDGIYADFIPAADGGANGEFIVSGDDGIRHAPAFTSTTVSRIGDFVADADGDPLGVLAL